MSAEEKLSPAERLAHFKQKAEECYAKMYESEPHNLKDWRDDACMYFARAREAAEELGLDAEKKTIAARVEHVRAVFNQLRTDGGGTFAPTPDRKRDYGKLWLWIATWGYVVVLVGGIGVALFFRFFINNRN